MNILNIKVALQAAKEKRAKNMLILSPVFNKSLSYVNNIENNKTYFDKINNSVFEFKQQVSYTINYAVSMQSNHGTVESLLDKLNNSIPENITSSYEQEIFNVSLKVYEQNKNVFNQNEDTIKGLIDSVNTKIEQYNSLNKKLTSLKEKIQVSNDDNTLMSLKKQKNIYETEINKVLRECELNIKIINDKNNINFELLEKGLKVS